MARIDLSQNEYMERFVGQDHIDSNDVQFWYQLLSCSFNFMRVQDPRVVDKTLEPYLVRLTLSNSQSFNIGSLVRVFLDRVSRIKSPSGESTNPYYIFQSFNALYLLRSICKSYIETSSEEQLVKSFRAQIDPQLTQPPQASQTPLPSPPHLSHQSQQQTPSGPEITGNVQSQQPYPTPPFKQSPLTVTQPPQATDQIGQPAKILNSTIPVVPNNNPSILSQPAQQAQEATAIGPESPKVQGPSKALSSEVTPGATMLDQFISTLINIIVDIPPTDSTYLLQVESINALIVLLSVQMYFPTPANQSVIYKCLMQKQRCSIHALILTKTLLNNFVRQAPVPQEAGSIIIGLASGLWKVLTLAYGGRQEEDETECMPLLARQSLILLNILTNHYTNERNPYREAIVSCQDSKYNLSDPQMAFDNANNDALATATTSKSILMSNSIKIAFHELYETICKYLHNDQVAPLLYLLLHSNKIFKPYILTTASTQLDRLVLPLLRILYSSIEKGSQHVYMVLITFVILTEENSFNESIQKITVRGVPWYKDRVLSEITLDSLIVLIIIRSFQYNTFRIKDKFLHSNLHATLTNLSNHFNNLHPYVCQRIMDLLERLSKRYLMATKPAGQQLESTRKPLNPNQTLEVISSDNSLAKALDTEQRQDLQDASAIELDSTSIYNDGGNNNGLIANHQNVGTMAININIPEQQVLSTNVNNDNNIKFPPVDMHGQEIMNQSNENCGQQSPNSNNSNSDHVNISMDDTRQDIKLIEEVLRMMLGVLNTSLTAHLKRNPDLIYTLLYKRNVFSSLLSSHQSFYNMVINIERVLTFFYSKIEAYGRPLSVVEIKELIQSSSKEWNYEQNRDGDGDAPLVFQYVEDEDPEEFFIPYIWTRIYYSSGIVWNSKRIALFNPDDL